jgi:hypothetical protein
MSITRGMFPDYAKLSEEFYKENPKQIDKSWAVYHFIGSTGIGKIKDEDALNCDIALKEDPCYPIISWSKTAIKRFDLPLEAIEYSLTRNLGSSKQKLIEKFLDDFPSEKTSLEKLLAQSKPKCTDFLRGHFCGEIDDE